MGDGERYVDIRRAAAEAEVSPRTVRRWLDEGRITAYRVPVTGRVRVAWSELSFLCRPQESVTNDDNLT